MNTTRDSKKGRSRLTNVGMIVFVVVVAFVAGMAFSNSRSESASNFSVFAGSDAVAPLGVDFTPLWKTWNLIDEKYVPVSTSTVITNEERLYGAVEGLASSLEDPYTVFLPPTESETFEDDISGNFEGVGMEIGVRNNVLTVIAPLKSTPAERAGIRSGDRILEIDGESTDGLTIDKAVSVIRGERGTTVEFTIAREGEDEFLTLSAVRDVISIPTIETELRGDGVFVIRLFNFSALSPGLFRGALREFVISGSDKLILDVRGNPGGFLTAAVEMASWFLPTGKVIVSENFGEDEKPRVHRSKGYHVFTDQLNMVVLINQGSASASEILAGALSEHGIATLVGAPTFGKGSVQELVKVTGDTSLKVTIARWVTPNGHSLSDGGLEPDVPVEVNEEDILSGADPQFEEAVRILLEV